MKNVFDFHLETQKQDGSIFQVDEVPEELWQKWERVHEQVESVTTAYNGYLPIGILPLPLQILTIISVALCMPYISIIIKYAFTDEITLTQAYANAPWAVILGICVIPLTILMLGFLLVAKILHSKKDYSDLFQESRNIREKIERELNIPTDVSEVDVLSKEYMGNSRQRKVCRKYKHRYKATQWHYFLRNDMLFYTDYHRLFAIELNKIESYRTIRKKVYMTNQTVHSNQSGITCFIPGYFGVREYGVMQINDPYGKYEVLIPEYDWNRDLYMGIKNRIEYYQKAIKVQLKKQEEILFHKKTNFFYSDDIDWNEFCECYAVLRVASAETEEFEQVKLDFISIFDDTSAWDDKLMAVIAEQLRNDAISGKECRDRLCGVEISLEHKVCFWYDMEEYYITVSGSLKEDIWKAEKTDECDMDF